MTDKQVLKLTKSDTIRILREVQIGNIEAVKDFKQNWSQLHWSELRYKATGDSILHVAARLGYLHIVKFLTTEYSPSGVDCTNKDDKTALHDAAQFGQYDIMHYLVHHGANVNALKRADWTPLMLACTKGNGENSFKCVEVLLMHDALVNFENKDGWTALHLICREGDNKILYLLIDYGLDVFKVTKNGRSGLHVACLHGRLKIVKTLVHLGLDANLADSCGNTPLHDAVLSGNVEACRYLVGSSGKDANVNLKNRSGFGALHLAASAGNLKVIEFLVSEVNMDINSFTPTNLTPLHCAARSNQKAAVKLLMVLGANISLKDNYGRRARDYIKS